MIQKISNIKFEAIIYTFLIVELIAWIMINPHTDNIYVDVGFAMGIFLTIYLKNITHEYNTTIKCDSVLCGKVIKDNDAVVHDKKLQYHYSCYQKELV